MTAAQTSHRDRDPESSVGGLCECDLQSQNTVYAGTGGVSRNNRGAGFFPAYHNRLTGESVISRFADGSPAPVHVLDGLPDDWVARRDEFGNVCCAHDAVVVGFIRAGVFHTREAAAKLVEQGDAAPDL